MSDTDATRPTTDTIVVTEGGVPPAEVLAALAVALGAGTAAAVDGGQALPPAWRRAALREGVGGPPMATPGHLHDPGRVVGGGS